MCLCLHPSGEFYFVRPWSCILIHDYQEMKKVLSWRFILSGARIGCYELDWNIDGKRLATGGRVGKFAVLDVSRLGVKVT
jgi:hypothetical protein